MGIPRRSCIPILVHLTFVVPIFLFLLCSYEQYELSKALHSDQNPLNIQVFSFEFIGVLGMTCVGLWAISIENRRLIKIVRFIFQVG